MEPKKISFGFTKSNKISTIIANNKIAKKPEANKVELIKCLEGQEIKLVEEKPIEAPLVIPLKESQKTSAALASLMKRRAVLLGEDEPVETTTLTENGEKSTIIIINDTDDIEKRAAQELMTELNANNAEKFTSDLVLPVVHPDDLPLEGAKESSLDDYDDIPIEQFGKAMLRGMGWVETPKPAKGVPPPDDTPMVRPKGMGLGADKALKTKPLLVAAESNEALQIKRNAYVRILGGKHKDLYGQIEGFDDYAGRVIVKMAIGGFKEAFNEFLCQAVSKNEYAQYGKCINSAKYEEYKRMENEHGQIIMKKEEIADIDKRSIKYEKIKRKTQRSSSDDDCTIVEGNTLKAETSSGSRENRNYNDHNINEERNYKREYKREDERERSKASYKDEERITKRENTREDYDGHRKRDVYTKDDKSRDGRRIKERDDEDNRELPASRGNREKELERSRANSRDRHESKYSNEDIERRRERNKDQRRDYRDKDYNKIETSTARESDTDDRNKYKKSHKDKKSKKKTKKSKKSKSKYRESCDSESSESSNSDSEEEERRKIHKKKTKKSKKERERSRSRGRR